MKDFILKDIVTNDILKELDNIGFDSKYKNVAQNKYKHKTLKIYNLTIPQANILKQTALSFGADCAVNKGTIVNEINETDAILSGSFAQLKKISESLKKQPFALNKLADLINNSLKNKRNNTKLIGILNVTPDSFSDGGEYNKINGTINHFNNLIKDGADIIDIGAESTRPGYTPVDAEEQKRRLKPILEYIKTNKIDIPISIDTRNSNVAEFALQYGVTFINDVSGLEHDNKMLDTILKYHAGIIIQHSLDVTNSATFIDDIFLYLKNKILMLQKAGVKNIIADVGLCFGKTVEQDFELINRMEEFYALNVPVMAGISRKSMLGVKTSNNELKDSLTLALSASLMQKQADYLRVHNVKLHKQLLNLLSNPTTLVID